MPIEIATALQRVARNAGKGPSPALIDALDVIRKEVTRGTLTLDERQAFHLLDILAVSGMADEAASIAECLWRAGASWTFLDRTYAHWLIEHNRLAAAQCILLHLVRLPDLSPFEIACCHGHLGRLYKALANASQEAGNPSAAATALESAVRHYKIAMAIAGEASSEDDADKMVGRHSYRIWRWAATNLVTLLSKVGPEESELHELANHLIARIEARPVQDFFDRSALGAAHLTLGRQGRSARHVELGAEEYRRMLDDPAVSFGQIERVLRDFRELRQELVAAYPAVADVRLSLLGAYLRGLKGSVVITTRERRRLLDVYQRLAPGDDRRLTPNVYSAKWLAEGLREASSIAKIVNDDGSLEGSGSGFVLSGESFGLDPQVRLLVTCAHVLSETGAGGAIRSDKAIVQFEGLRDGETISCRVEKKVLFESNPDRGMNLDATIAVLQGDAAVIPPLLLSAEAANEVRKESEDEDLPGGYTIGHPLGMDLSITLGPAKFTERYTPIGSTWDAWFLRYTTDTMGGNSGGPVFDRNWRVVAVHQRGSMDGGEKAGRGLIVQSLVALARKRLGL